MLHAFRRVLPRAATVALLALAVGAMAACNDDDDDASPTAAGTTAATSATTGGGTAQVTTIKVQDNQFSPGSVTIAKGAKVTWDWAGSSNPHGIIGTSDNAKNLESKTQSGSGTYEATFRDAGEYDYHCVVHGVAMSGKIIVQ